MPVVYRVDWQDHDQGCLVEWFQKEAKAKERVKDLKKHIGGSIEQVYTDPPERIEIPSRTGELVEWLNLNLSTDNG